MDGKIFAPIHLNRIPLSPPPRESQNWHSGKDRRVKSGERKKNHSKKAYPTCKSHVIRSAIATPLGMSR